MSPAQARSVSPTHLFGWVFALASLALAGATAMTFFRRLPLAVGPQAAWMMMQAAIASGLCALGMRTSWRRAAFVACSFWMGASAQLGLTEPLWFQSVRLRPNSTFELGLWGLVVVEAVIAASVLLTTVRLGRLRRIVGGMGPGRLCVALLALLVCAFGAGRLVADRAYFGVFRQFAASYGFVIVHAASLAGLAASLPGTPLEKAAAWLRARVSLPGESEAARPADLWFPWLASAWTLAASLALCLGAFGAAPHLPDEVGYLFQARYLAEGALSAPPPPAAVRAALDYDFLMIRDGRWFSILAPGWPAVLAVGVRLGAAWLVNPLLGAASVLLTHSLVRRFSTRGDANLVALLMAVSPWQIAMSASLMTHSLTLFCGLAAVLLLTFARDGRTWAAFPAGAAMGLMFLARPIDGLVAGVLAGLWTLTFLRKPRGWLVVIAYGAGCVAAAALILPYNAHLVGNPLLPPLTLYQDLLWGPGSNRMGFGPDIGPPSLWNGLDLYRGHSPFEALLLVQLSTYSANWELLGWPGLSLGAVVAWAVWARRSRFEMAMTAFVAVMVAVLALYWFADTYYIGPRYLFLISVPLMIISAGGLRALAERLTATGVPQASERLGAVILLLCLFATASFLPWRAATRYHDHRNFYAGYNPIARSLGGGVVFVPEGKNEFASAMALNSPFLAPDHPIFLKDLGPEARAAAARAFPGRPLYVSTGRGEHGARPRLEPYAPPR